MKWEGYFETSIRKLECCILSVEHTCVGYSFNYHDHVVAEFYNLMLVGSVNRCTICMHLEILSWSSVEDDTVALNCYVCITPLLIEHRMV